MVMFYIVMIVDMFKYSPKPPHSNLNMLIPVNSKECGVICSPERGLPY